jgi:O-antigen/teichoic acid export membrane protein
MTEISDATEAALEAVEEAAPEAPSHRADSVRRNTFFGLATNVSTAAFTAVLTLFLVRKLGPHDYGLFALAVSIGTLVILFSDLGITGSAGRFIAEEGGNVRRIAAVVSDSTWLKLFVLVPLCILLWLLAEPISNAYNAPGLIWPLRGMAIAVLGQGMFIFYRHVFVSIGRVALTWRMIVFESACELGASIALVLLGAGAAGATFGRGIAYLIGTSFGIAMVWRALGGNAIGLRGRGEARRVARYGSALLLVTVAYTLFEQIGVLLIGAFIGPQAVGVFEAPNRLTIFLSYAGSALAYGIGPRLARRGDQAPDARGFTRATRALLLLQGALLAPVIVWAEPIAHVVLGSGYADSAAVLRALSPFMFMLATGTFLALTVNFVGEAKRRIWIAVSTVAVCAAIDVALLPTIGVVGAAIGMDVAFAGYVLGHYWICRRVFEFPVKRLLLTLVRCLVAAVAMAAVLALIGTSSLSPWQWLAGVVLGPLAYLGVLLASRELTRGEIAAAAAQIPWWRLRRCRAGRRFD